MSLHSSVADRDLASDKQSKKPTTEATKPLVCPIIPMNNSTQVKVRFRDCSFNLNALVDTGANCSCISNAAFSSLPSTAKSSIFSSDHGSATTAGGDQMNLLGQADIHCFLGNNEYTVRAYVVDSLVVDMVLGHNFLAENNAQIDIAKSELKLKQTKYSVRAPSKRVHVKDNSQKHIYGILEGLPPAVDGYLKPHPHLEQKGLFLAHALCTTNRKGTVLLRIMNINDKPAAIPKNMKIATFEPLDQHSDIFRHTNEQNTNKNQNSENPSVNSINFSNLPDSFLEGQQLKEARDKIVKNILWGDQELTENQKEQLLDTLARNAKAFSFDGELGKCDFMPHTIDIEPGSRPIYRKPYRYNPKAADHAKKHIKTLLEQDIIEPCISPWNAPLVIVNKPRQSPNDPIQTRLCIDFRGVNEVTVPDRSFLPRLDSTIDRLGSAKPQFFSTIDLIQGFFQQTLDEKSKKITAFSFEGGQYSFKRLPMGLKNSPATYTRLMELVLRGLQYEICLCYIDDVVIFSRTFEEHLVHIEAVLQRLIKANLKIKIQKCCFAKKKIKFLGNILSSEGWSPNPEKTRVIEEYVMPKSKDEVKRFLGMVGFYRKFVPNFPVLAAPLYNLLKQKVPFEWDSSCESAFLALKQSLLTAPVLGYPDFEKGFNIYTDASLDGLSAMLTQVQPFNGEDIERVLWYSGRSLNKHEKNYTISDLELTAIHYAIKQFLPYIQFNQVTFYTDHKALQHLENAKPLHGRLARVHAAISPLDHKIIHRPGSQMAHADCISRFPTLTLPSEFAEPIEPDFEQPELIPMEPLKVLAINSKSKGTASKISEAHLEAERDKFDLSTDKLQTLKTSQSLDPECQDRIDLLNSKKGPEDPDRMRLLLANLHDFVILDDVLYRVHFQPRNQSKAKSEKSFLQLVVPKEMQQDVIQSRHNEVHFGFVKNFHTLFQKYWWPGMLSDIERYNKSCTECQQAASKQPRKAPLKPLDAPRPWHTVGVDITEPGVITAKGNRYILVFIDLFTKYCVAVPIPDQRAETVAKAFFERIICVFGSPERLLSDRGSNFLSKIMEATRSLFMVKGVFTSSYHPETDGQTERMNQTLMRCLKFLTNDKHDNWDECIPPAVYAYNTSPCIRSSDFTPHFMIFGRYARSPLDFKLPSHSQLPRNVNHFVARLLDTMSHANEVAKENIEINKAYMKQQYDKKTADTKLKPGDKVFLYLKKTPPKLSRKLRFKWVGPYVIQRFIMDGTTTVKLTHATTNKRVKAPVHVNRLKKCIDPNERPVEDKDIDDPEPNLDEGDVTKEEFAPLLASQVAPIGLPDPMNDLPAPQEEKEEKEEQKPPKYDRLIEKIMYVRQLKNKPKEYYVRWAGRNKKYSWVAETELNEACQVFIERTPLEPKPRRRKRRY